MYVYNPSNFSVNYANSAGNADTVDGWHADALRGNWDAGGSHGDIGYQKFSNGWLIQWGYSVNVSQTNFPMTFPNACRQAVATYTAKYDTAQVAVTSFNRTTLYFGNITTRTIRWIAVGH